MAETEVEKCRREDEAFDESVALTIVEFVKRQRDDWAAIKREADAAQTKDRADSRKR